MKILKSIFFILFVLIIIAVVVGFLLPKQTYVARSIVIDRSAEVVFPQINSLQKFYEWSPWREADPNMVVSYSGPTEGVGNKSEWLSDVPEVGNGTQEITQSIENTFVETQLDLGNMGTPTGAFELEGVDAQKDQVKLTWSLNQVHGNNLIGRYFGLFLDDMLGPMYEKGLKNLKTLVESQPYIVKREINYSVGDVPMTGYLAYPSDAENAPGVLVVHEWWGHNDYARRRADMLAELGYVAFALDMYGEGKVADHPKDAQAFMMEVISDLPVAEARFRKGLEILTSQSETDSQQVAAIGYCFGGAVVTSMARAGVDLDGVVSFHGSLGGLMPITEGVDAKFLVLNGAADPMVTEEHKKAFKSEMAEADLSLRFIDYPDAVHAFTNPGATELGEKFGLPLRYDPEVDEASWNEMKAFLAGLFSKQ